MQIVCPGLPLLQIRNLSLSQTQESICLKIE